MLKNNLKRAIVPYLLLLLFILSALFLFGRFGNIENKLSHDEFVTILNEDKITELEMTPNQDSGVVTFTGKLVDYKENEMFTVDILNNPDVLDRIIQNAEVKGFTLTTERDPASNMLLLALFNIVPILILVIFSFIMFTKIMKGNNKSMDFGRSKAKLHDDKAKVTFDNVAGLSEEKEEVLEIIDFLKNPKKFEKMGARIPKGVLLEGYPGTGKTLLAKAVAGEANVPFYYISGSDFVELYVGVGASRVRDMFKQAKYNAPCLIFIDEIDAVGRRRGAGIGGGHDEREQTLNQLLTEMDGFGANEGIIVIAATNRSDVLDPALLRPGRFDRKITVSLPDVKARREILEVHAKNKFFDNSVTLENLAKRTPGFSGADLENLLNEAALLAARANKKDINMADVDEATDRVLMGPAKASRKYTEKDKQIVAYHEAGHVVLGLKLDNANIVHKVTIIPRSNAGGYAMMLPKEERYTSTKSELLEEITGLLAGRVSEEIKFNEITTGAQNDFSKATRIARSMVTEYGMSSLGAVQYEERNDNVFLGRDYNNTKNFSNEVAHNIDKEVSRIIEECYKKAKEILSNEQELVDLIANSLIEHETLTEEMIQNLLDHKTIYDIEKNDNSNTSDDTVAVSKKAKKAKKKKENKSE